MKLLLFLFALLATGQATKCKHPTSSPEFSKQYTVSGTLTIPYAELTEPFMAWYDPANGVSRIDYYGGMVKTYQFAPKGSGDFGSSIKIAPMTTEDATNIHTCFQVNGTYGNEVETQGILPDMTNFQCDGSKVVDGINTEKWIFKDVVGEKVSEYTMYIRWKKDKTKAFYPVPVRYEMKGYNSLLGSHYDHYYLEYENYCIENVDPVVFDVTTTNLTCGGFPGPGLDHTATFNPMKEFINSDSRHVETAWTDFKEKHSKKYQHEHEHEKRKMVFRQNLRYISSKNRANLGYTLSVNHLADRTDDEMRALRGHRHSGVYNGGKPFPYDLASSKHRKIKVPEEMDWRLYGAVTPVKDQSVCGSCWSFGTTGTVEGAYFLKTGHLVRLSQQALIDCSWAYGNNGCDGGEDFRAYQWIMKHGGLPLEAEYGGYLGQDGYCHINETKLVAPIREWVNVTTYDAQALKLALFKHGPISVAIDAAHKEFSFYSNGVYYNPDCKNGIDELDHAVLAVGYGKMNGQSYWLVKNSWSNMWGNDGYVLMSAKDNNCGVMTMPTYVVM